VRKGSTNKKTTSTHAMCLVADTYDLPT